MLRAILIASLVLQAFTLVKVRNLLMRQDDIDRASRARDKLVYEETKRVQDRCENLIEDLREEIYSANPEL